MMLSETKKSEIVKIVSVNGEYLRKHFLIIGIKIGDKIVISQKIRNGPVLIKHNLQEIALGNKYSKLIEVAPVHD